jgi:hypothetical protein
MNKPKAYLIDIFMDGYAGSVARDAGNEGFAFVKARVRPEGIELKFCYPKAMGTKQARILAKDCLKAFRESHEDLPKVKYSILLEVV